MRAVVFGDRDLGVAGLEALDRAGFDIAKVYTRGPAPGDDQWYRSVAAWCADHRTPVSAVPDPGAPETRSEIAALGPELLFFLDYQAEVVPEVSGFAGRSYQVHLSLAPAHYGPQPIERALIAGDKKTGVSLIRIAGPSGPETALVDQGEIYIGKDDDHISLYRKLAGLADKLLGEVLPGIKAGSDQATALPAGPALEDIDPRINWFKTSWDVYNKVRALTRPNSGAYSVFLGERMIIWRTVPDDSGVGLIHPREIEVEEGRVLAGASFGSLRLEEIEWRGLVYKGRRIAQVLEPHWREKFVNP